MLTPVLRGLNGISGIKRPGEYTAGTEDSDLSPAKEYLSQHRISRSFTGRYCYFCQVSPSLSIVLGFLLLATETYKV